MHLLAIDSETLDEAEAAIDLGQTPADIVILSFSDSDLSALAAAWRADSGAYPSLRLASLKKLRHPMSVDLYVDSVVAHAKMVIVRSLGGLDYWRYGFERIAALASKRGILLVALPGDDRPDPRLVALSTVGDEDVELFERYFREGGAGNATNLLRLASRLTGRNAVNESPVRLGSIMAVSDAGESMALEDCAVGSSGRPTAFVLFYRSSLLAADIAPITRLLAVLRENGLDPIGLAVTSLKDPEIAASLSAFIDRARPAVIINATAFSAMRADDTTVLDRADCAVLQIALAGHKSVAWQASPRGLSAVDLAMNVVLPELDGRVFTRAVSFKAEMPFDADLEYAVQVHEPQEDRIAYVADLAAAWVRLRVKPAASRRIAIMLSDYPGRGGRTGYACGLDTPQSAKAILDVLKGAGYGAGEETPSGETIISALSGLAPSDEIAVRGSDYGRWLAFLPQNVRDSIAAQWGNPEQDPAYSDGCFRFRCVRAGHILIVLQPDRGSGGDRKSGYHDTTVPPRHAYVALYAWLREQEKIDALVHLGTHGTLEWLPGKALALSAGCFPEAVLGAVPVIYPFIVNNPAEAVQAKRRIAAVTIGHLTPPLCEAGLHGPLGELEGLIEEYADADGVDARRQTLLEREILERAWRSGLASDCALVRDEPPREQIAKLDAQLCDIKDLAIRDHLHIFACPPSEEAARALTDAVSASLGSLQDVNDKRALGNLVASCASHERNGLLAALDGRRVAPGPSGAPTRGRRDVLPTGRNLTSTDPRSIPTRVATIVGARAAEEVVRRYMQDHGEYPRSVMVDLWASASLRTGGDDIAQALAYLGVRPLWDNASNRVTGIEVVPLAKMERPRIDVTLRISGSFRDIFPAQIALLELAVHRVAAQDEPDDWNPLVAERHAGRDLVRIFGGAPGTYGAGAAEEMLDRAGSSRADIAQAYLAASSHAYGGDDQPQLATRQFEERLAAIDALIHPQDDRERDLLDGDGVADFVGGFAAATAEIGRSPSLYHLDTSKPESPIARTVEAEIVRIVRGRLTNPRWIAGMLNHGHRGVSEVAQAVDALYAFAVSAAIVPNHLFESVHEAYIADERVLAALLAVNPAAVRAMALRLEDAIARRLWTPHRNAVHGELASVLQHTIRSASGEARIVS
jgi:cobaltochelatase CobN